MDFERIYKEYYKEVYYVCLKYMNNEEDALDMAQNTFIKAYDKIEQLKDEKKIKQWLCGMARNGCIDLLRHNNVIAFDSADDDEEFLQIEDKAADIPEDVAVEKDVQEILMGIIDSLSDPQRVCVTMYYYDNLTIKEIANELGCPEQTVRSRLNYAKKAMKDEIERLEDKGVAIRCAGILPFLYLIFRAEFTDMEVAIPSVEGVISQAQERRENADVSDNISDSNSGEADGAGTVSSAAKKMPLAAKVALSVAGVLLVGGIAAAVAINAGNNKSEDNNSSSQSAGRESVVTTKPAKEPTAEPTVEPTKEPDIKELKEVVYVGNSISNLNTGKGKTVATPDGIYYCDKVYDTDGESYTLYKYDLSTGQSSEVLSKSEKAFTGMNYKDGLLIFAKGDPEDNENRVLAKWSDGSEAPEEIKYNGEVIEISDESNPVLVNDWIYYHDNNYKICRIDIDGNNQSVVVDKKCYYICPVGDRIIYQSDTEGESLRYISLDGSTEGVIDDRKSYLVGCANDKVYYEAPESEETYSLYECSYDGTQKRKLFNSMGMVKFNITEDGIHYWIQNESAKYDMYYVSLSDLKAIKVDLQNGTLLENQLARDYDVEDERIETYNRNSIGIYNLNLKNDKMAYSDGGKKINLNSYTETVKGSVVREISNFEISNGCMYMNSYLEKSPVRIVENTDDDGNIDFETRSVELMEMFDSTQKCIICSDKLPGKVVAGKGEYYIPNEEEIVSLDEYDEILYDEEGTQAITLYSIGLVKHEGEDEFVPTFRLYDEIYYGLASENVQIMTLSKGNKITKVDNTTESYDINREHSLEALAYIDLFLKNWYMNKPKTDITKALGRLRYSGKATNISRDEKKYNKTMISNISTTGIIINENEDQAAIISTADRLTKYSVDGHYEEDTEENDGTLEMYPDGEDGPVARVEGMQGKSVNATTPDYINGRFSESNQETFINYAEKIDNIWYITDTPSKELKKAATDWASKQ